MHDLSLELWRCELIAASASDVLDEVAALVDEDIAPDPMVRALIEQLVHVELPVIESALPCAARPPALPLWELGEIELGLESLLARYGWDVTPLDEDPPALTEPIDAAP